MKKVTGSSQNKAFTEAAHLEENKISPVVRQTIPSPLANNERVCPSCGLVTIAGMPGGRDATCSNCGYKDPCCYD